MITRLVVYQICNYRLIAADLSKQKSLDADSKAIQQIIFTDKVDEAAFTKNYYIHEKVHLVQFTTFTKNQNKQLYNFLKEQQKFCN